MRRATRRPAGHRIGALALGAVAGGALLLGQAGVAFAGTPNVTISSPSNGGTVTSATGFVASGAVSATTSGGSITGGLTVSITNLAGHPGYTTSLSDGWCGQASCNFGVKVPELAWNGAYTVAVSATETDPQLSSSPGSHNVTVSSSFYQAAPPAPPRSLYATPASNGQSVSLSWAANTEPDLVGYEITRSPAFPDNPTQATTGTSFTDTTAQPGVSYTYGVQAVRSGANSNSTVASSPSSASATTPAPAPTSSGSGSGSTGGTTSSGSGSTSGAGGSAGQTSGSGSGSTGTTSGAYFRSQPSGSAPSAQPEASASLSAFQSLLSKTRANTSAPALAAPTLPEIPEDGVGQPGADNPTVAPFSSGVNGTQNGATRSALVTYDAGGRPSRFQSTAAVALAALLVAIATHLLWLRRQITRPPTP